MATVRGVIIPLEKKWPYLRRERPILWHQRLPVTHVEKYDRLTLRG